MSPANVVRLNVYTTDVDTLIGEQFAAINSRFAGNRPSTIVGVAHLPAQLLLVLEATAVD